MNHLLRSCLVIATFAAGPAQADTPADPVAGVVEAVQAAARRIQVDGTLYALSSTVQITWKEGPRIALRDLPSGVRVRMYLRDTPDGEPVITALQVLQD